jgi:hypothetical protein
MSLRVNWSLLPTVVATAALATGAPRRHDRRPSGPGWMAFQPLGVRLVPQREPEPMGDGDTELPRRDR